MKQFILDSECTILAVSLSIEEKQTRFCHNNYQMLCLNLLPMLPLL